MLNTTFPAYHAEQVCQLAAGNLPFEPLSHLSGFLRFQADLRLPSSVHGAARQAHVQHLIQQLGLQKVSRQSPSVTIMPSSCVVSNVLLVKMLVMHMRVWHLSM